MGFTEWLVELMENEGIIEEGYFSTEPITREDIIQETDLDVDDLENLYAEYVDFCMGSGIPPVNDLKAY